MCKKIKVEEEFCIEVESIRKDLDKIESQSKLRAICQKHVCEEHVCYDHVYHNHVCLDHACKNHACQDHVCQDHVCQDQAKKI